MADPLEGYIYLIQVAKSSKYKIGFSKISPNARLCELQVGNPDLLILRSWRRGTRKLEKGLHFHFRSSRIRGEWFELDSNPINVIARFELWEESDREVDLQNYLDERLLQGSRRICRRFRTKVRQISASGISELDGSSIPS